MNQFFDFYHTVSDYYFIHPELQSPFPEVATYFQPDYEIMKQNSYRFNENYLAFYIMSEINFGNLITFLPGVRYEKVSNELWGWYYEQVLQKTYLTGHATYNTHKDDYFLPNAHLKIRPTEWLNINLAYTNTLNRPDFLSLVPIIYVNTTSQPQELIMGNPQLNPEFWYNYDLQVEVFGNKIGYFGIDAFYKEVKNMIWSPTIIRTPGESPIPGFENVFGPSALVNITQPINSSYKVYIKGLEFDWQTNLWYLSEPFNFFTLNINYTLMKSATRYPRTEIINTQVGTDDRGRPIYKLVTNYFADEGSMIDQPNNIANFSLGFNYKGLNLWISYSFTGKKLLSFNPIKELDVYGLNYQRYDLQLTQKLPIKGIELLLNFANINNPTQTSSPLRDPRATLLQNYGWTIDFGLRYSL